MRPLVLGPDNVPVIADERQTERDVPLAVLSAMTHGRGPQAPAILDSLAWRDLMTAIQYFWRHPLAEQVREEGREEGREQGRAEAKAEMVLQVLEWRGISVPDTVRERVSACTDLDQLETWAQRAVHATDAAELFADD